MTSLSKNVFNVKSDTRLLNYQGGPIKNSHEAEDVWAREYRDDHIGIETIDPNLTERYLFGQGTNAVARIRESFGIREKSFFLYAVTNEKSVFQWKKWNRVQHVAYEELRSSNPEIVPLIGKWKIDEHNYVVAANYQNRQYATLFLDIARIDDRKERIVIDEQKRLWEEDERLPLDAPLGRQVKQEAILLFSNTIPTVPEVVEDNDDELEEGVYNITVKTIEDQVE